MAKLYVNTKFKLAVTNPNAWKNSVTAFYLRPR